MRVWTTMRAAACSAYLSAAMTVPGGRGFFRFIRSRCCGLRGDHNRLLLLLRQAKEANCEECKEEQAAQGNAHRDDGGVVVAAAAASSGGWWNKGV